MNLQETQKIAGNTHHWDSSRKRSL